MDCIRFEVGNRLKRARQKKRISQEKLAELAELNISYIGQVERGEKNPSIETVYRICKALDIDMAKLFENLTTTDTLSNQYPEAVYSLMLDMDERLCRCFYEVARALTEIRGK